jgi:hypothetical protein
LPGWTWRTCTWWSRVCWAMWTLRALSLTPSSPSARWVGGWRGPARLGMRLGVCLAVLTSCTRRVPCLLLHTPTSLQPRLPPPAAGVQGHADLGRRLQRGDRRGGHCHRWAAMLQHERVATVAAVPLIVSLLRSFHLLLFGFAYRSGAAPALPPPQATATSSPTAATSSPTPTCPAASSWARR